MEMDDEELFGSGFEIDDTIKKTKIFKERREAYGVKVCSEKTDEELFECNTSPNEYVKETVIYKERKKSYVSQYYHENIDGKNSQDILLSLSQTPLVVTEYDLLKERLSHLSMKDKSEKVIMKSIGETIQALRENPSKEGKEQQKILAASLTSMRFGVPGFLGLHQRDINTIIEMKRKLLVGEENVLRVPSKPQKKIFPDAVKKVAEQHWENITITEPAKHRRISSAVKDGEEETLPTLYQIITNDECYQSFKEICSEEIRSIMHTHAKCMHDMHSKRPDSEDKRWRLQYAEEVLSGNFLGHSGSLI